jgi:hypothetical protein
MDTLSPPIATTPCVNSAQKRSSRTTIELALIKAPLRRGYGGTISGTYLKITEEAALIA